VLEGPILFVVLLGAILGIIVLISVLHLHPFIALLLASFGIGLVVRMPLQEIVASISNGFGGLMAYIGLVIIFGTIIGTILEKSGGALKMADVILSAVGQKRPALAMSLIGAIVSVPVFCDSGFVILSRLNKAIASRANVPLATLTVALASGLYATHTLVPPTPGPIAAAGNIGAADYLGIIIGVGLITSIPVIAVSYWWANRVGKSAHIEVDENPVDLSLEVHENSTTPGAVMSFAPILMPIALIATASIVKLGRFDGGLADIILFLGQPMVALLIGVGVSLLLLPKFDEEHLSGWIGKGVVQAGPILLITGAGGAFGSVLKATPIAELIGGLAVGSSASSGLFLIITFLIAAALKSSQGSSTAALVITSSLIAPILPALGIQTPLELALVVMAIGSGAMAVSHVNDSYFWVVTQFSGLKVDQAYRVFTSVTLLQGITGLATTLLIYYVAC
jgi:GntP family gluconate:H+ symporter